MAFAQMEFVCLKQNKVINDIVDNFQLIGIIFAFVLCRAIGKSEELV